jgi:AcrR family transcriptional regulator
MKRQRTEDARATRQRLLDAAIQLFADRGYRKVTVRDIAAEAKANIAAVSYHFGDKLGLYMEVVRLGVQTMRGLNDLTLQAPPNSDAEQRLRHYVSTFLVHLIRRDRRPLWVQQLVQHEMADPTPATDVLWKKVIKPRLDYLADIVAELLDCPRDDLRVNRCVGSIQGQCLIYAASPFLHHVWPQIRKATDEQIATLADHIARFTLAGVGAISRDGAEVAG